MNITLISGQNTLTANTNTAGIVLISPISKGIYTLSAEKNGYETYTQNEIKVQIGKTVRQKLVLTAIS